MSGQAAMPPASPVARGRTSLPGPLRAVGAAGCALLVMGGATWVLWPKPPREPVPSASRAGWTMGQQMPDRPLRVIPTPEPVVARVVPPPPSMALPVSAVPPPAALATPRAMGFWQDDAAIQEAAQRTAARASAPPPVARPDPDVATPGSDYAQRMTTTRFADTAPVPHRFHVAYTIKKGTTFGCTPAGVISSALPGPVQCTVDDDVWSMDGTTILLPRGTQVNGTVERGLGTGEQRLFLVWTDALTPRPDLLAIPLDAPAADELGQSGVPGDVNDHLWRRVKAALLLSVVDIGGNAVTALAQRGNGNTNLNLGGLGGQATSLGQQAFGRDIGIPATLYRGPGQPLVVYVPKFIDLWRFYKNEAR